MPSPWRFLFDKSMSGSSSGGGGQTVGVGSPGLDLIFDRAAQTVDPLGYIRNAQFPRFDREVTVSAAASPTQELAAPSPSTGEYYLYQILNSGYDKSGPPSSISERMIVLDFAANALRVYRGGNLATFNEVSLTEVAMSTDAINHGAFTHLPVLDFTKVTMPAGKENARVRPCSAVICHGLIAVVGMFLLRKSTNPDIYDIAGWCMLTSLDDGATYTHAWDDSDAPAQFNHPRGREWCLRAAPAHQRVTNPTEYWLVSTDYRYNGSNRAGAAEALKKSQGGRVYVCKVRRTGTNINDWNFVAGAGGKRYMSWDFPAGEQDFTVDRTTGCHAHAAHAIEWGSTGIQVVVSLGDTQVHNRIARIRLDDTALDFTVAENWTVVDQWHGQRQTSVAGNTVLGTESSQPVGMAWGGSGGTPTPYGGFAEPIEPARTLLCGCDERAEYITRLILPNPTEPDAPPTFNHGYGWATGYSTGFGDREMLRALVFLINERAPETSGPLATALSQALVDGGAPKLARVLYVANAGIPARFAPVATVWTWGTEATAAVYGGKVYFAVSCPKALSTSESVGGIWSVPTPSDATKTMRFKPVLIAPGGRNLVITKAWYGNVQPPNNSVSELTLGTVADRRIWQDGTVQLPPVPSLGDRAVKIVSSRIGHWIVVDFRCSSANGDNWYELSETSATWAQGPIARRFRAWILDGNERQVPTHPSKTTQLSLQLMDDIIVPVPPPDEGTPLQGAPVLYACSDRWMPVTAIGPRLFRVVAAKVQGLGVKIRSNFSSADALAARDDNICYLVLDSALDGPGSLPYPTAPDRVGSSDADEQLHVQSVAQGPDLGFASSPWTLRLAGIHPIGNWDQYSSRSSLVGDESTNHWPLLFLQVGADTRNGIELSANCSSRSFRIVLYVNDIAQAPVIDFGLDTAVWLPDSPLLVALSYNAGNPGTLQIGASLGGCAVQVFPGGIPVPAGWGTLVVNDIKFAGRSETVEYRWIGGEITDAATSQAQLASALATLDWLGGPTQ